MWLGLGLLRKWDSGSGSECTRNGMSVPKKDLKCCMWLRKWDRKFTRNGQFRKWNGCSSMGQEVYRKWSFRKKDNLDMFWEDWN